MTAQNVSQGDNLASLKPVEEPPWHSLIRFEDLPHWQQDNHYILSSYRRASYSYIRSIQSMTHWHNETINIWTHFLPGALFLPFGLVLYQVLEPRYELADNADVTVMLCFFLGAGLGMSLSGIYHTLSSHSPGVAKFWNQLDYVGIALMIWGSFIPSVFYGFWSDPGLRRVYWSMISTIGAGCIVVTMLPAFRTPSWRPLRAAMFAGMGLSAVFPVLHGLKLYGLDQMRQQMGLFWLLTQGALYIAGATIYACRFPESMHPGRYDKVGASHQIFHVFVVLAAASHLVGLLKAFDYRHGVSRGIILPDSAAHIKV